MLELNFKINYNEKYDILYIRFMEDDESYGKEIDDGIVLNYNFNTNQLTGIDIWDFKQRIKGKENIDLPVSLNLQSIYECLGNIH